MSGTLGDTPSGLHSLRGALAKEQLPVWAVSPCVIGCFFPSYTETRSIYWAPALRSGAKRWGQGYTRCSLDSFPQEAHSLTEN